MLEEGILKRIFPHFRQIRANKFPTSLRRLLLQLMATVSDPLGGELGYDFVGEGSGWGEAYTECLHLHHLNADTQNLPRFDTLCETDLSVKCFECEHYLDAQVIVQLRSIFESLHLMKFGEAAPSRTELKSGDPVVLELS